MSLASGTRLGPYEVTGVLGTGGMGEVYKARDTRLDRTVAIKVLPHDTSSDPDRRARFEREAKTVAALSHPHICPLFDVGDHSGALFLVMEHLVGHTLAERLEKGPLALDQVLTIATEISDALSAAHRQGVIHRDLKPANVMLTKSGAKLLDFGLAKLTGHGERPAAVQMVSAVPTQAPLTGQGSIVGTLQYMAPEQLEGKVPDARTDLWALGTIIYEMVTGKRAFEGTSTVNVMGSILEREPPSIGTLQPSTPPALDRLVRRCVAKSPDDRPDTAHDVADELRWLRDHASDGGRAAAQPRRRTALRGALLAAALLAAALAGAGVTWLLRPTPQSAAGLVRSLVSIEPADRLQSVPADVSYDEQRPSQIAVAVSPDGRLLVFSAVKNDRQQLYLRPIHALQATPIQDTEGGASPFFSPDGQWIGFWANGAIKKVAVAGGPATTVCESEPIFGASWGEDGTVVFAHSLSPLYQVSATGGTPRPVTTLDSKKGEVSHRLPQVLPGAKAVLFTAVTHFLPDWDSAEIVVQPLAGGARKTIARGADARYVATGHLVFMRWGTLVAAPFDLQHLEILGGGAAIVNDVMQAANTPNSSVESGAAQLAVASSGLLAYATGGVFRDQERELVWVDRNGRQQPLSLPPRAYLGPHLSPDGQQVLLWTQGRERVVWVYDLRRGTMTRVTSEGRNSRAIWAPDGRHVTYASATAGPEEAVSSPADGSGASEPLHVRGQPSSWTPDGRVLALMGTGVWNGILLLRSGEPQAQPLLNSRFTESYPEFSPDGRWIAYVSNETGSNEVYVQPYPGPGERRQISNHGGTQPAWARDGRELFYTEADSPDRDLRMMSVPLTLGPRLVAGLPRMVFQGPYRGQANTRGYDVSPDGRRFLMVRRKDRPPSPVTQLVLVQNWFEELKAKVPLR